MNERIRVIRKNTHLNMEQFGKRIGITKASVSRIESGENNPSDQTIILICKEFNINETWLRTGEGEMYSDEDIDFGKICAKIGVSDPKAKKAIMDYWKLSEDDKQLFFKFVEKFMK